jgi:hypothetical protein
MKTNFLKLNVLSFVFLISFSIQAQTSSSTDANLNKDAGVGASIKVIDNKGTIKYLQTNNGITSITSTSAGNRTTTTWQLGGTLTDNTYIAVDGNVFSLNGLALVDLSTESASTDAVSLSSNGTGTGWTLLVRDEATGATKKLLISDLIESAQTDIAVNAAQETANAVVATLAFDANIKDILVFRNGAKLRAGIDYTVATTTLTIDPPAAPGTNQDWDLYEDDIIEIHYSK